MSFSKRKHTVKDFELAKKFLLDNNIKEKDIEITKDSINFEVKDAILVVNKNENIFFEGVF